MTVISYSAEATLVEPDLTESQWHLLSEPGNATMPYSTGIDLGGESWLIEYEVIRGRQSDYLSFHLFINQEGTPTPVLDTALDTGMQLEIDEKIRIYAFDIQPYLQDNYLRDKAGTYQIMVSEVQS